MELDFFESIYFNLCYFSRSSSIIDSFDFSNFIGYFGYYFFILLFMWFDLGLAGASDFSSFLGFLNSDLGYSDTYYCLTYFG